MYDEPDWSSLSVLELLEKAQEFAKQAYGKSLSSYAFIERALDRMPVGTKGGEELAELMGKAQSVYQTIIEVQQQITQITETLSQ
jgi:flagellar biosynthesis chaperone FliJ